MKKLRDIALYIVFIFAALVIVPTIAFGQETKISGNVYDSQTREPLPFVNIRYIGGRPYTTTDVDGNFSLSASSPTDSIEISYIGYKTKKIFVKKNIFQKVSVALDPDLLMLHEIVILPGENPAHRILRKVISHKDQNNKEKLQAYQYEVYNKIEFDMNNIPPSYKNKKILKPIKFVFDYIDSTSVTEKPYLPLLLSESLSDFYWRRNPNLKKEVIKANKVSGIQDKSISQFMGEMYQNVNIYDNNILVFGKQFPSPISDHALEYYKYYLIDSGLVGNRWCYHLQFKPRRKQEFCFAGNIWIADTCYAVKRLEMSIPSDVNLNFVKTLNVVQEYVPVYDTDSLSKKSKDTIPKAAAWVISRDRLVADIKYDEYRKKPKQIGFYARKTTAYRNFVINQPRDPDFFNRNNNIIVLDSANNKSDAYWKQARHDTLSKNEMLIYHIVDTIKSLPIYHSWYQLVYTFITGYKQFGPIELGPYYKIYSHNAIEGNRFRIGGRTTDKFSVWQELSGYLAYGTRDEAFKWGADFKSFLTKKPRQIIYFNYKDDLEILGQSSNAFSNDNILATAFRRTPLNNMTGVQQYATKYELEPFQGFNMQLSFTNRIMSPKGIQQYNYVKNATDTLSRNNIISSEANARFRFAFNEKYMNYTFSRTSIGTRYPVITLDYTYGMKGVFGSDYTYHKIALNVNDRFRINPLLGYTDYIIEAGKIFGTVPYPLLTLHGGNETIIYDPYAFNMMNYYEFASDQYLTIQVFHHFDGFFLNHIPIMRKLKWREVVTGKAIIGDISKKNKNVFIFPGTLSSLNRKPYYEVSAGIENIFKVFRVDALWRLSYIDKKYEEEYKFKSGRNKKIPKFAIMWSLSISF